MKKIEINGNLRNEDDYEIFSKTIKQTIHIFNEAFGVETMHKYGLYIDNATQKSGYTPTITVVLDEFLIIKLHIFNFWDREKIVYQLSHELCHYVFHTIKGLDKPKAGLEEENICSAMSLIIIKILFPSEIDSWTEYVDGLKEEKYNKGGKIARECNFDINILKEKIYELCEKI